MKRVDSTMPGGRNRYLTISALIFAPAGFLILALLYLFFIRTNVLLDHGIRTDLY